jgi:methylmalonyl-CoA mutase N-terminal domain/subunit
MFDDSTQEKVQKLLGVFNEQMEKRYGDRKFDLKTDGGISINPVYSPADIDSLPYDAIGMPGQYPFTRGIYPTMYQTQPWVMQQIHGHGLPEHCRERMDYLAGLGLTGYGEMRSYNLVFDHVCKFGYDPDNPEAGDLVGLVGVNMSTLDDYDRLLHGLDLEKTSVVLNQGIHSMIALVFFIVYGEQRGVPKEKLRGNTMNWLYKGWMTDLEMYPPKSAFMIMSNFIRWCSRNMPLWNTTNIVSYFAEEAGGTAIQEAAMAMSISIALTEACIEAGCKPDEFLPRFGFQIALGSDLFEHVAKIRAMRRLWATINKERFGAKKPHSMQLRCHSQTSAASLTAQQPFVNIVRSAYHALVGVLAGVNGMTINAYDEALGIPTDESLMLSIRTHQVALYETGVPNVTDPLAGSYYVEWLTNKIYLGAEEYISKIDKLGGFLKCWESGWLRSELANSAYEWRRRIDSGEKVVVGLNKFQSNVHRKTEIYKVDPHVKEVAVRRIQEYRAKRGMEKERKTALENLKKACEGVLDNHHANFMPALIECARTRSTVEEMASTMKSVFGWGSVY